MARLDGAKLSRDSKYFDLRPFDRQLRPKATSIFSNSCGSGRGCFVLFLVVLLCPCINCAFLSVCVISFHPSSGWLRQRRFKCFGNRHPSLPLHDEFHIFVIPDSSHYLLSHFLPLSASIINYSPCDSTVCHKADNQKYKDPQRGVIANSCHSKTHYINHSTLTSSTTSSLQTISAFCEHCYT